MLSGSLLLLLTKFFVWMPFDSLPCLQSFILTRYIWGSISKWLQRSESRAGRDGGPGTGPLPPQSCAQVSLAEFEDALREDCDIEKAVSGKAEGGVLMGRAQPAGNAEPLV